MNTPSPPDAAEDFRFGRQLRLRSVGDFRRVYARRCSQSDRTIVLYGCENGLDDARLGLSVSRKVGGAVVRNRWKRLIREAFRTTRCRLPSGIDFVVIPRRDATPSLEALQASLIVLAERVARRLASSATT